MLKRVEEVAKSVGPKGTFYQVSEENGGYLRAASASNRPRNCEQAKDCRSILLQLRATSKNVDSLAILLQECNRQQMSTGKHPLFIGEVIGAPELRCVLAFTDN